MFGDFQAHGQIKAATDVERVAKLVDQKPGRINQERFAIEIVAVHAQEIRYSRRLKLGQPGAQATADVDHARRFHEVQYERNRGASALA